MDGFLDLVSDMQPDRLGKVIAHPPAGLDVGLGGGLDALAGQPEPGPQRLGIARTFMVGGPKSATPMLGVALQRPAQPKHPSH